MVFGRRKLDPDEESRLAALEKRFAEIEDEWNDWFDKFRRLHARLAKREKADAEETADAPPALNTEYLKTLDPITATILARRGNGLLPR